MRIWLAGGARRLCRRLRAARGDDRDKARGPGPCHAAAARAARRRAGRARASSCSATASPPASGLPAHGRVPALLQQRLKDAGLDFEVVNAGVSGDTSAGGLARLDWALDGDVRVLIVALGGNDGLRGLPLEQLERNLAQIIERAQARGITVMLAGMEAPPNYGRDYIVAFHKVYPALAAAVPRRARAVSAAGRRRQRGAEPARRHPSHAEGARIVADNVWAVLKPIAEARSTEGVRS